VQALVEVPEDGEVPGAGGAGDHAVQQRRVVLPFVEGDVVEEGATCLKCRRSPTAHREAETAKAHRG